MRHGRRLCSEVHSWESTVDDPYRSVVSWSVPENITVTVTLFHAGKVAKCEDKNWMFVVENVSKVMEFLVHNAFIRTDHRTIAMMFVHLSVCLSVHLSGMGVHCDHTVHFSADLSLWFNSPFQCSAIVQYSGHPDTKACTHIPSHLFPVPPGREVGCGCAN